MESMFRIVAKAVLPARVHHRFRFAARLHDEAITVLKTLPDRLFGLLNRQGPHGLGQEVIVSLTSYPPRFRWLHRTISSILKQRTKPDRVVLWISASDAARLPAKVSRLQRLGLEIRTGPEIGSYRKLLPALNVFPDAFIVTADDDVYYRRDWLKTLIDGYQGGEPAIICLRAHRPCLTAEGRIAPYSQWERDIQDVRESTTEIIPTGVGGVLYPPFSLDPAVQNAMMATRLCPTTDDFWFFWMARRAGSRHRRVGSRFRYVDWPGSQKYALHKRNLADEYDRQIAALTTKFGVPEGLA